MGWCHCAVGGVCRRYACVLDATTFLWRCTSKMGDVFCYKYAEGINGMRDKIHMNGTGLLLVLSFCLKADI